MQATISGRYILGEQLGAGGMGMVYRAQDRLTGETVALKQVLLKPAANVTPSDTEALRLALSREFHTMAGLRHPHIVSVLDYGFDQQRQPFFTMTLLDHPKTIAEAAQGKSRTEQIQLLVDMLLALSYIHRRGVIHRDLKPANVLVDSKGTVKVLDFGLAVATHSTMADLESITAGTLAYMAPELFMQETATVASDLYATGVIACELLNGKHPFESPNIGVMIAQILNGDPDLSGLEDEIEVVLEHLLAKKPGERYLEAETVIAAVCQAVNLPMPPESLKVRESFLQASEFIGRTTEMEHLRSAIDALFTPAKPHRTQVYLIGGESGVGKSRLLDELRTRALVQGVLVLRGQGVAEGGLPYQLWRDVFRQLVLSTTLSVLESSVLKELVPDIDVLLGHDVADAPELTGEVGQSRLILTLVDVLKRQTQPCVLLLEDLQWAAESLAPIKQILLVQEEIPHLLVLGTYRDDEAPHLPTKLSGAQTLKLPRFDMKAIADLAQSMLGETGKQPQVLNLLKRETEGNAFFMVETVRALAEGVGRLSEIGRKALPEKVFAGGMQQMIRRRLSRAPEWTQPMLKLAAVAGRELDLKVLSLQFAVHSSKFLTLDTFLSTCAEAAVIEIVDGRWRFAHDKLRETVLEDLSDEERRDLNRQVAEAIEAAYPDDVSRAVALVEHWGAAGEKTREAQYTVVAAEQLIKVSSFREALVMAERGLKVVSVSLVEIRLLKLAGNAHEKMSDYASAIQRYQKSLSLSQQTGERSDQAAALRGLGRIAENKGDYAAAQHYTEEGLELEKALGDREGISACLAILGHIAFNQGDYPAAKTYYENSLTTRREMGDRQGVANGFTNLGVLAFPQGEFQAARAYFDDGLTIFREIGNRQGIATCLGNLGMVASAQGDHIVAKRYYEDSQEVIRQIGDRQGIASGLINLGVAADNLRDYAAAKDYYQQSLAIYREIGDQRGTAMSLGSLGNIAYEQMDYDTAINYYQESLVICRTIGFKWGLVISLNNLGFSFIAQDHLVKATAQFREGLDLSRKMGILPFVIGSIIGFARIRLRAENRVYAAELAGLVTNHPMTDAETRDGELATLKRELGARLPSDELAAAMERGKTLDLDTVIKALLSDENP